MINVKFEIWKILICIIILIILIIIKAGIK
jgi:hypothetical protein